jgi:hypothetical protein
MTLGQLILGGFAGYGMYRAALEILTHALPRYARWRNGPVSDAEVVTERVLNRWAKAEADRRARRYHDRRSLALLTDDDRACIGALIRECQGIPPGEQTLTDETA